jgi:hypothetical protein
VVFSLSEAFGHKLKSLFSREYFALSINMEKGIGCARIMLHQLTPSSYLGDNLKKYFFTMWCPSREDTGKAEERY